MKPLQTLLLTSLISCAPLMAQQEGPPEWRQLFDGKTLSGWTQKGGKATYRAEAGMIVGATVPDTPNSFLCTEQLYADFVLEYEFLVDPELNSGVQIRSAFQNGRVRGYQVEIDPDEKRQRDWTAGIYEEGLRGWLNDLSKNDPARAAFKQRQWNHVRVEARGAHLCTWLNDVPAADLLDGDAMEGFIGLQVHGVGARKDPLEVRWRNIRLEDLGSSRWVATDVADKKAVTVLSSRGDDFALRWKLRLEGGPGWIDWPGGRIELKAEEGQEEISIFLCRAGERLFLDVRGRARAETSVEAGERKLLYVSTVNGGSARLTVLSAEELLTGK